MTIMTDSDTLNSILPCDQENYYEEPKAPTAEEIKAAKELLARAGLVTSSSKVTRRFSDLHLYGGVCSRVHELCRLHPELRRSELVRLCESEGIATNTAKTQIQKYLKAHKSASELQSE